MEDNSIDNAITQFYDKKVDVPAEKVHELFGRLVPAINRLGIALWQLEIVPGRLITGFPGGSFTQDIIYVKGLMGYQFFDIDKTIRNPEITASDIVSLVK